MSLSLIHILFVLNWQLSLLVVVGYAAMFLYIRYSGRRSRCLLYTSRCV